VTEARVSVEIGPLGVAPSRRDDRRDERLRRNEAPKRPLPDSPTRRRRQISSAGDFSAEPKALL